MVFHYPLGQKKDKDEYCLLQSLTQTPLILPSKQLCAGREERQAGGMLKPGFKIHGALTCRRERLWKWACLWVQGLKSSPLTPHCPPPTLAPPSSVKGRSWYSTVLIGGPEEALLDIWRACRHSWYTEAWVLEPHNVALTSYANGSEPLHLPEAQSCHLCSGRLVPASCDWCEDEGWCTSCA